MPEDKKSQELILAASGMPFKLESAVWSALSQKGLDHANYEVVPFFKSAKGQTVEGFAARPKTTQTFVSESEDGEVNTVESKPYDPNNPDNQPSEPRKDKFSGYQWVKFSERGDLILPEDVELHWNGETLVFKRGELAIAPNEYLAVADATVYDVYVNVDGNDRKEIIKKQTFPYTVIRPATKEEFESKRKQWTNETIENLQKFGSRGVRDWNY